METLATKVFKSGNSQAVRIPKEFQLNCEEVLISKEDDRLIIKPKYQYNNAVDFFEHAPVPTDDFMSERAPEMSRRRESL